MLDWRSTESLLRLASVTMSSMTFLYSIASTNRLSRIASFALPRTSSARGTWSPSAWAVSIARAAIVTRSTAATRSPSLTDSASAMMVASSVFTSPYRFSCRAVDARQQGVGLIEVPSLDRMFRGADVLLRPGDVDVRPLEIGEQLADLLEPFGRLLRVIHPTLLVFRGAASAGVLQRLRNFVDEH